MKRVVLSSTANDEYVIVNKSGELFKGPEKMYGRPFPSFTSYKRNNYSQAKKFKTAQAAEEYVAARPEMFQFTEVVIMTFAGAMDNLGDTAQTQSAYKKEQEERRRANQKASNERQKARNAETKKIDPGKYKVVFYYSTRSLGSEVFRVDAQSIDDAFKKAKEAALKRDPYCNTSGYDQKLVFNKNNIIKIG